MSPFDIDLPEREAGLDASAFAGDGGSETTTGLPAYLRRTYAWAYLWPRSIRLLDRGPVVSAILWGNYRRLCDLTLGEFRAGQNVLQPACVYGDLSARLADHLGPAGHLVVSDVAAQQIANCRGKLAGHANTSLAVRDAADYANPAFDGVCCFFLLHEMPNDYKTRVVDALLSVVRPGGAVVFVDYHRPRALHPLGPLMGLVFDLLEPYARALWRSEIRDFATRAEEFHWTKQTYFGGLYQKTVARRPERF